MRAPEEHCKNESCFSNSIDGEDFFLNGNNCEVQVDIITQKPSHPVIIWGTVKDCCNEPIKNALVKLMKYEQDCKNNRKEICRVVTDCSGCYRFDLCQCSQGRYRVVVCKASCDEGQTTPCIKQTNRCHPKPFYSDEENCVLKNKVYYY